ncbi:MAG TPA: DNRLRE domain-containing protein, partial [Xanthomonadales bacterium]|nr:DNRLRE domain-containing protein [Xanthomonadales bacterium]
MFLQADTAVLEASTDATLYQTEVLEEDAANGSGSFIFTGVTKDNLARRAVIRFDVAGAIPAGATIDSVDLTLNVSRVPNPTNLATVGLHRLNGDWGEGASDAPGEEGAGTAPTAGDTTWRHTFFPGSFWTSPGGDFVGAASASISIGDEAVYTWNSTAGMVADVQSWLDQPANNFGWIIVANEDETKNAKRFDSRENIGGVRPSLEVSYTTVVAVGSCCNGSSCQVVTESECSGLGGMYGGDGTSCSPNPCSEPEGACCANAGTCTETTHAICES